MDVPFKREVNVVNQASAFILKKYKLTPDLQTRVVVGVDITSSIKFDIRKR